MNRVTQFMLLRLASVPEQEFLRHIHAAPRVGTSLPFVADHVAQRALAPPSLCVRARGASGVLPAFGYHGSLCCGHRRAVWVDAWEWNYGTLQQLWVHLLRNHQIVLHTGAPFYISSGSVPGFHFLHICAAPIFPFSFCGSHPTGHETVSRGCSDLHLPND